MNSSRESMDLGISQTGKNTAYSRIRANNHIVMSEVRCSSLENVYIRVPNYFVHWPLTLKTRVSLNANAVYFGHR
jgi:hypothetical protein